MKSFSFTESAVKFLESWSRQNHADILVLLPVGPIAFDKFQTGTGAAEHLNAAKKSYDDKKNSKPVLVEQFTAAKKLNFKLRASQHCKKIL